VEKKKKNAPRARSIASACRAVKSTIYLRATLRMASELFAGAR